MPAGFRVGTPPRSAQSRSSPAERLALRPPRRLFSFAYPISPSPVDGHGLRLNLFQDVNESIRLQAAVPFVPAFPPRPEERRMRSAHADLEISADVMTKPSTHEVASTLFGALRGYWPLTEKARCLCRDPRRAETPSRVRSHPSETSVTTACSCDHSVARMSSIVVISSFCVLMMFCAMEIASEYCPESTSVCAIATAPR